MHTILTGIARRIERAASAEEAEAADLEAINITCMLRLQYDASCKAIMQQLNDVRDDFKARETELLKLQDAARAKIKSFRPSIEAAA